MKELFEPIESRYMPPNVKKQVAGYTNKNLHWKDLDNKYIKNELYGDGAWQITNQGQQSSKNYKCLTRLEQYLHGPYHPFMARDNVCLHSSSTCHTDGRHVRYRITSWLSFLIHIIPLVSTDENDVKIQLFVRDRHIAGYEGE